MIFSRFSWGKLNEKTELRKKWQIYINMFSFPHIVTTCRPSALQCSVVSVHCSSCSLKMFFLLIMKIHVVKKLTRVITSLNPPRTVTTCHLSQPTVCLYFWWRCLFCEGFKERKTEGPGNHFIAGHFPNDKGWRWNDESWNDMISLAELGAPRWKTGSLCSAAVSVLPEPWNNDPSLFISVYAVNHNTSEMSLAFRRRTIDLVCALPHQRAVTGLHPNWGN